MTQLTPKTRAEAPTLSRPVRLLGTVAALAWAGLVGCAGPGNSGNASARQSSSTTTPAASPAAGQQQGAAAARQDRGQAGSEHALTPRQGGDVPKGPADRADPPLVAAAKTGDLAAVNKLIAQGTDVNAFGDDRRTALMQAAAGGHAKVVEALLAAGADANLRDGLGWTAQKHALETGHDDLARRLEKADVTPPKGPAQPTAEPETAPEPGPVPQADPTISPEPAEGQNQESKSDPGTTPAKE